MDEAVKSSIKVGLAVAGFIALVVLIGTFLSEGLAMTLIAMTVFGGCAGVLFWSFKTKLL